MSAEEEQPAKSKVEERGEGKSSLEGLTSELSINGQVNTIQRELGYRRAEEFLGKSIQAANTASTGMKTMEGEKL